MSAQPSAKTGFTILGGAITTVLVWIATEFTGIQVPAEVAAALTTIVAGLIAWFVPAKSGTYVENPDLDWSTDQGSMADYADEETV